MNILVAQLILKNYKYTHIQGKYLKIAKQKNTTLVFIIALSAMVEDLFFAMLPINLWKIWSKKLFRVWLLASISKIFYFCM